LYSSYQALKRGNSIHQSCVNITENLNTGRIFP